MKYEYFKDVIALFDDGNFVLPVIGFFVETKNGDAFYVPTAKVAFPLDMIKKWDYLKDVCPDYADGWVEF